MSTEKSGAESSIRVVMFSGDKRDWVTWSEKWLARAGMKGFKKVATGEVDVPDSTVTALDDEQKKAVKANEKGYSDLILSMDTDKAGGRVAFNIVKGTKSSEYPDGNVQLAYERLKKK